MFAVAGITVACAQGDIAFTKGNFPDDIQELNKIKRTLSNGNIHFDNGSYEQALINFEKARSFNPKNAEVNYKLGMCYFKTKADSLANIHFQNAYVLNNKVSDKILYYVASSFQLTNQFEKATKYFELEKQRCVDLNRTKGVDVMNKRLQECKSGKALLRDSLVTVENLGASFNSPFNESSLFFSKDESTLFLNAQNRTDAYGNINEDIYVAFKSDADWTQMKNVGKPVNTTDNDAVIGIGNNGSRMYLYSNLNNGDIYFSDYSKETDDWSDPLSISIAINSSFKESSICFSESGLELYFISDRAGSMGGTDIYVSKKTDEKEEWSTPQSLGSMVNSTYDEEGIFIDQDTLYFSSRGHNSIGGYDVFKSVRSKDNVWSKPENLGFPINSTYDDLFYAQAGAHAYFSSNRNEGFGGMDIYRITKRQPVIVKKEKEVITISNLLFESNQFELTDSMKQTLTPLIMYLSYNASAKIQITGHTDAKGNEEDNLKLSKKRAQAVKAYLLEQKCADRSILIKGAGEKNQIAKNTMEDGSYLEEGMRYNRRVEIALFEPGENSVLMVKPVNVPFKFRF